jgi:TRAP-type C4-dicarboxylate transport system permease small subunit
VVPANRLRVVALGAGVALAIALPAALLAQVLEALRDTGDDPGALTYALAVVVLVAVALGGCAVGRQRSAPSALLGAVAGLAAITVVLALGIARRLVAGDDVAWGTVPATAVLAMSLAATGSALTARRTGRTRP